MEDIHYILDSMTLKEKVGQLFQIGFPGKTITDDIKEMIKDYYIGGIIYFSRNIESLEQLNSLSNGLQRLALKNPSKLPLFISTDQEGGTVTRLKGATHFPGQMAIGATNNEKIAEELGVMVARELRAVGINMNLAPVLDVNNNPENPVIGVRSFGGDPKLVANLGTAYIKGLQGEGVIACGKHFPGHGDTTTDSHLSLPIINVDSDRLERVELYPFKKAIEAGIDSIMTAHVYFPAIEKRKKIPATLSHSVLTGLLREKMKYNGLIITDCMEMNAIVSTFGTVEGSILSLEAGSDMVLISHTIEKAKKAINKVIESVQNGRISEERIDESVKRLIRLKKERISVPIATKNRLNQQEGKKIAYHIARNAVTLLKDEEDLLPVEEDAKALVIDFKMGRVGLAEENRNHKNLLIDNLKAEGLVVKQRTVNKEDVEISDVSQYDIVIICTYNARKDKKQVKIIEKLQKRINKLLVLSIRDPYELKALSRVKSLIIIYDYSPANFKAASDLITGKIKAKGKLPVMIK